MSDESERRLILQMIESGKISAAEGLQLLQALEASEELPPPPEEIQGSAQDEFTTAEEVDETPPEVISGPDHAMPVERT